MTQHFAKILYHPDKELIINKLTSGESARSVEKWLKDKYSDEHFQVSYTRLIEFKKKHLNIQNSLIDDLKDKLYEQKQEEIEQPYISKTKRNKTYNEKIKENIPDKIDWEKKLAQLLNAVEARFASLYDMAQDNPNNYKPDRIMIEWMRGMLDIIKEIRRAQGSPDKIIHHDIAIQVVDQQVAIIQQAVMRSWDGLDLETQSRCIEKFNAEMEKLKAPTAHSDKNISKLEAKIETITANTKLLPKGNNE